MNDKTIVVILRSVLSFKYWVNRIATEFQQNCPVTRDFTGRQWTSSNIAGIRFLARSSQHSSVFFLSVTCCCCCFCCCCCCCCCCCYCCCCCCCSAMPLPGSVGKFRRSGSSSQRTADRFAPVVRLFLAPNSRRQCHSIFSLSLVFMFLSRLLSLSLSLSGSLTSRIASLSADQTRFSWRKSS